MLNTSFFNVKSLFVIALLSILAFMIFNYFTKATQQNG